MSSPLQDDSEGGAGTEEEVEVVADDDASDWETGIGDKIVPRTLDSSDTEVVMVGATSRSSSATAKRFGPR